MSKNKEELNYDVRIVDRNIREGAVSKKDYDKYVKGLPDVEEKGEPLVFEDEIEEEVSLDQEPEAAQEESETEEEKEEETQ